MLQPRSPASTIPEQTRWTGVTSFLFVFFGFFNKATAYTPGRIFTQNTSNDVVPGKEVPFGGLDDYIFYLDP